jgi:hypothetical protein
MLTPHYGENSELGEIWLPTEDLLNALELPRGEAVLLDEFWGDCWLGSRHLADHRQIHVNESARPLNHSNKNFHQIATSLKRPATLRTTNLGYQNEGGIMVKKTVVAFACVLIASPAFAQTTTNRTRQYRTTTAITSVEGVTVTAPIIASEGGSVASYQPAGTLVIRTDSANPERFDLPGPGLVYDKFGRPVTTSIKPGTRVRVFYADLGPIRTIDHVIVE